jgi:hypothetical protein
MVIAAGWLAVWVDVQAGVVVVLVEVGRGPGGHHRAGNAGVIEQEAAAFDGELRAGEDVAAARMPGSSLPVVGRWVAGAD